MATESDANPSQGGGEVPRGRSKNRDGQPQMTPAEKAIRDAGIVASCNSGMSTREVGREFGITKRSVERIRAAFNESTTPLERAPMEIVERQLRSYESQMRRFVLVAMDTLERAPAVAIAALRGEADALERYTVLLERIGKLPDNLELFRSEMEIRRLGELMVDALEAVAAGDLSAVEALERFDEYTRRRRPLWETPGESSEQERPRELPPGDAK